MAMPYWAVARTNVQHEQLAASCLATAGYEVLFPRVKAGGAVRPLFACYLFVALGELGQGWHVVNRTIGVIRMVAFGDKPARVPDPEIEALKRRMDGRGLITLPPPPRPGRRIFLKGERVQITGGPLAGLSALHTGMTAHERELVLVAMLGAQRQVAIAAHLIAARC
jgi:transcriptional antiterminator RfaH